MRVTQFICRSDNFGVLLHDEQSGLTASIDAPDAQAIEEKLKQLDYRLDFIFITHHHLDHVEGIANLKRRYNAKVIGPKAETAKIAGLDLTVSERDPLEFAGRKVEIIATPGHTAGEISYYFPVEKLVFTGDTLFSLGCGRLFEGTPAMMLSSLQKLRNLPDETRLYCGHEYTQSNARFALTIDPDNVALRNRAAAVDRLVAVGEATLPSSIGLEKATNPFLRWDDPAIRQNLAMENGTDEAVFAEIRKRKDQF